MALVVNVAYMGGGRTRPIRTHQTGNSGLCAVND